MTLTLLLQLSGFIGHVLQNDISFGVLEISQTKEHDISDVHPHLQAGTTGALSLQAGNAVQPPPSIATNIRTQNRPCRV